MPNETQDKTYEAVVTALFAGEGRFKAMEMPPGTDGRYDVAIGTPFLYLDGDHMMFYVEQRPDGSPGYRLTDSSDTIGQMKFLRGLESELSPEQERRFREVVDEYGAWVDDIGFDNGELHMSIEADQIGFGIAHFAQLQIRLSAICMFDNDPAA